ncbi:MAG: AMP-binding protein [Myxococcota bacterium]
MRGAALEAAPRAVADDRPALVLQTSGTTGEARGVVIGHGSLAAHTRAVAAVLARGGLGPGGRVLGVLPLAHSYGCRMALLAPLLAGAAVHLVDGFSARGSLALIDAVGITWAPVVPTMLAAWAAVPGRPTRPTTLAWVLSAGAPLPDAVRVAAEARLGRPVRQGYGLSEASFATLDAPPEPATPGSVGRALPGVEVRVDARGEVEVRGANLMLGYEVGPEHRLERASALSQTSPDGWFATGDLGRLDADGRLTLVDRLKDIVLVGGHTVYPAEVEAVLAQHPGVAAVAVVGRPDAFRGEALVACVVPAEAGLDLAALRAFAAERLTAWKVPSLWERRSSLPLGPSGKVLRRLLRRGEVAPDGSEA